jgi:hypothetical protein
MSNQELREGKDFHRKKAGEFYRESLDMYYRWWRISVESKLVDSPYDNNVKSIKEEAEEWHKEQARTISGIVHYYSPSSSYDLLSEVDYPPAKSIEYNPNNPLVNLACHYLMNWHFCGLYSEDDDVDFDDKEVFRTYSLAWRCLSASYKNYDEMQSILGVDEPDLFSCLADIETELKEDLHELIGYWTKKTELNAVGRELDVLRATIEELEKQISHDRAELDRIHKQRVEAAQSKTRKKLERIAELKGEIEKIARKTQLGYEIPAKDFDAKLNNIMGVHRTSDPTRIDYRKKVSELLGKPIVFTKE